MKYGGTVKRLNHVTCDLKEYGSQDKEENRKDNAESNSRLKVSSVGEWTIFIGSLFHEMGSLTEKAAFLRSKQ